MQGRAAAVIREVRIGSVAHEELAILCAHLLRGEVERRPSLRRPARIYVSARRACASMQGLLVEAALAQIEIARAEATLIADGELSGVAPITNNSMSQAHKLTHAMSLATQHGATADTGGLGLVA